MTHTPVRGIAATFPVLLAAVAVAATLTGCTARSHATSPSSASPVPASTAIADDSAHDIVTTAQFNVSTAESVHIVGHVYTPSGKDVDCDYRIHGHDGIAIRTTGGVPLTIIKHGDYLYIRGDKAYWTYFINQAAAKVIGDKWLRAPADEKALATYLEIFELRALITPSGALIKGHKTSVNGLSAVTVDWSGPPSSTLYVATVGLPLPLRVESDDGRSHLDFTYGEQIDVTIPPAAQVITVDELRRQLA